MKSAKELKIDPTTKVTLRLNDDYEWEPLEPVEAEFVFEAPEDTLIVNGKTLKGKEVKAFVDDQKAQINKRSEQYKKHLQQYIPKLAKKLGIDDSEAITQAIETGTLNIETTLSVSKMEKLLEHYSDQIDRIELSHEGGSEVSIESVMGYTQLDPHAYVSPTGGSGVNIYIGEFGACPYENFDTRYHLLTDLPGDSIPSMHAVLVSAVALTTAPQADVYCRQKWALALEEHDVESYSFHFDPKTREYTARDKEWDKHVYETNIAVFKAAGNIDSNNTNGHVTDPGHAYNVITVGNYDPASSEGVFSTSCYVDPLTGVSKPEIIAPGANIYYNHPDSYSTVKSGTSFASPHAAGFAADMMSKWSGFKTWSHSVKAAMMVVAERESGWSEDKTGAGLIKFDNLYKITYNRVADNQDNSYLNTPKTYDFTIAPYKNVKIALSWLNKENATISMDLNLKVENLTTHQVWQSASENNPFEIVSFNTGSQSATYRVTVNREDNNDASTRVHYTFFVLEK